MAQTTRTRGSRLRAVALVLAGVLAGTLLIQPVGAHFTQNTKHLGLHAWKQVVKDRVYTRKQANNRYYPRVQADATFPQRSELSEPGTLNDAANPVDWTKLKGVPQEVVNYSAGFGLLGEDEEVVLATHGPLELFARCAIGDIEFNQFLEWGFRSSAPYYASTGGTSSTLRGAGTETKWDIATSDFETVYGHASGRGHATAEQGGTTYMLGFNQDSQVQGLFVFGHNCLIAAQAIKNTV